jgi:hypothetical protein
VLDPAGVPLVENADQKVQPSIAFGTDRSLVVWRDDDNIRGARVTTTGNTVTVQDPGGFAICEAGGIQSTPSAIFLTDTGRHFAVAWADERDLPTQADDIYAALVGETTAAVTDETAISTSTETELRPQFSRGKIKKNGSIIEVLLGYQKRSAAANTDRVMLRKVTYQP